MAAWRRLRFPRAARLPSEQQIIGRMHVMAWLSLAIAMGVINLIYIGLAIAGLVTGRFAYVGLLVTFVVLRSAFLGTLENPEPRYVVEFFAFVVAVGSVSLTDLWDRLLQLSRAWRRPAEQNRA